MNRTFLILLAAVLGSTLSAQVMPGTAATARPDSLPGRAPALSADSARLRAASPPTVVRSAQPSEQPTVTNVFYESDLVQALHDIASQTGVSIITDGTVGGVVTLELVDASLEDALTRILYPLGFAFRKMEGYYLVGSAKPDGAAFYLLANSEIVTPSYLRAEDAFKLLPDCYHPYVKLDSATNSLTITAPPGVIAKFRQDLAGIDRPPRQVAIEALVTEISHDNGQQLGVDWSGSLLKDGENFLSAITGTSGAADTTLGIIVKAITSSLGGGWAYSFMPTLQALIATGKAKVRANPRVVTIDGQTASINVGQEQYYQMVAGNQAFPYVSLEKIDVGVSLNITPHVSDSGDITLNVEPTVSDVIGHSMTELPIISKRSVKTSVRVKDGERIVIGGLLQSNERDVRRRIPILGQIPILGLLFSHTEHETISSDVVVVITPHVLKQ